MPVDATAVAKLKQACDQAADLHPNSCSHAVWHVIKQYLPDQPYMSANALMDHLQGQRHWRSVPASQVGDLARGGAVIVGGKKESGHGHVIVVYPGPDKAAGGYAYIRGGKTETLRTRGSYPPAMSTSMGPWEGARSKGTRPSGTPGRATPSSPA
ncbi:hypothetical protein AVHY2522_18670 [Acidovorax sp. SUPP2522]|uniref:hypothetical protein n=1 Tax=unclassified Acidovorax TaxID=2684926 RepID=UPI0023491517|nr:MULTISPECIES: hypothetical protein [unclassified Acidovorax]WCM97952.1 hypothetical protein M5C96_00240 [Acidovorax sp. GBBC 1281]GKT18398.1 hypothetical protein AVHY2522_18670 [Acidovorax sp. SUPP2522]